MRKTSGTTWRVYRDNTREWWVEGLASHHINSRPLIPMLTTLQSVPGGWATGDRRQAWEPKVSLRPSPVRNGRGRRANVDNIAARRGRYQVRSQQASLFADGGTSSHKIIIHGRIRVIAHRQRAPAGASLAQRAACWQPSNRACHASAHNMAGAAMVPPGQAQASTSASVS
jgi:hypothetical protein